MCGSSFQISTWNCGLLEVAYWSLWTFHHGRNIPCSLPRTSSVSSVLCQSGIYCIMAGKWQCSGCGNVWQMQLHCWLTQPIFVTQPEQWRSQGGDSSDRSVIASVSGVSYNQTVKCFVPSEHWKCFVDRSSVGLNYSPFHFL